MNGNKILIDTNICIYLLNGDQVVAELLQDQSIYISVITEMELYVYHTSDTATQILNEFILSVTVIDIDQRIKQKTIDIRRASKLKLPDSLIAASALIYNLPFISADKSFKKIHELDLIYYSPQVNE